MFEKQNVAFMVGLAFCIAASCNFPVLLLSIFWRGLTTRGAVIGGLLGLISAVVMAVLSPAVWEATLGHPKGSAPFPYEHPGAVLDDDRLHRHLAVLGDSTAAGAAKSTAPASTRNMSARRPASAPARPRRTEASGPRDAKHDGLNFRIIML